MGERRSGVIPPRQGRPPQGPSPRQVAQRRALALAVLVLVLGGLGWLAVAAIGGGNSSDQAGPTSTLSSTLVYSTVTRTTATGVVERAATEDGLARLAALIADEEAERVVVGLPLTLRGERGEQVRETEAFVEALVSATDVPVVTFDERFTTDLAEQTPADAPEDARAAAHLLSGYLTWASSAPA